MRGRPPEPGSERISALVSRPPKTGVEGAITEPPRPMTGLAREIWDQTLPEMISRGVYISSDRYQLYLAVMALAVSIENMQEYHEMPDRGSPEGKRIFVAAKDSSMLFNALGSQMALTPVARYRLGLSVAQNATLLSQYTDDED